MSICIAESCESSRTDHSIILSREIIEILYCILPLAKVSIAETCIEISKVCSVSTAIVASNCKETLCTLITIECLFELFVSEEFLCLSDGCRCLLRTWVPVECLECNRTSNDYDYSNDCCDDNFLVLQEYCFLIVQVLLCLWSFLVNS